MRMMVGEEEDGRDEAEAEADMMGGWSVLGELLRFGFACVILQYSKAVRSLVISTEDTGSFVAVCSKVFRVIGELLC